ncbi:predicted protein [Nematostella vectensis]|uniref:G-protein coupled receptors family 1 profile domain-containing protein n=1 Tax=Nematostella vectensis TaxID=45351 RepID=A7SKS2_NEMVE|nr:pyroglutamylated RF-amide peptide receptor [Nematostella vectensis]EDO35688.1 predicted protein [Nematostella vectensis]|eukprot:XP_001627788.1 predicted protein [Nematostella vectensis]
MNTSSVTNSTSGIPATNALSPSEQIGKVFALAVIFVVSLVGNALIIITISKYKALQKSINYFILNMAVSDLILTLVTIPMLISKQIVGNRWLIKGMAGLVLCKTSLFLSDISPVVSILSLVFMSFDRFVAVVFPLWKLTSKTRVILNMTTWIIACAFYSPYFHGFKIVDEQCILFWGVNHITFNTVYWMVNAVTFIILPFAIITIFYVAIFIELRRQLKKSKGMMANSHTLRQKQNRKIAKLAFCIVFAFGICYGPLNLVIVMMQNFVFKWKRNPGHEFQQWYFVSQLFSFLNAAINPIICIYFNRNLYQSLRSWVCGKSNQESNQEALRLSNAQQSKMKNLPTTHR